MHRSKITLMHLQKKINLALEKYQNKPKTTAT